MGLILVFSAKNKEEFKIKYPFLQDPTFLLVLIIFSGIAAVFKLLSPVKLLSPAAGNYPIIGDIIPALAGLLGCIVFFNQWSTETENQIALPAFLTTITEFERPIGFFCVAAGVIHLLFSEVIFL